MEQYKNKANVLQKYTWIKYYHNLFCEMNGMESIKISERNRSDENRDAIIKVVNVPSQT